MVMGSIRFPRATGRRLATALVVAALSGLLPTAHPASGVAQELPAWAPDANAARDAIPAVYKWDLSPMFASDAAWEAARQKFLGRVPELARFQGKLADPASLRACLDLYFDLHNRANYLTLYSNLRLTTAQSNDACIAMQKQGLAAMDELMTAAQFLRAEILALPQAKLDKAFQKEKGLAAHRPYLENLRRRAPRLLGPDAERAVALLGDNLWAEIDLNEIPSTHEETFRSLLSDIPWPKVHDAAGKEVQLTLSNYPAFRASPNRDVRREAVSALMGSLRQYQHAFAATLNGQFELDVALARARGYKTAREAYMDKDDIDPAVFDNLVSTVGENAPLLHRYVELRRRTLGLPDLHLYDLYLPLVPGVAVDIDFPAARRTVLEALQPLGPEVIGVLSKGLDPRKGWLDLFPHADKESGAFCSSVYGVHPFVKMNYQNNLDDMSTLAHEFGHALHAQLTMDNQPYSNFRSPPFLAEIASTCNEALLSDHLIAQSTDKDRKIYLLAERLETIRTTIMRQTLFAEFEDQAHGFAEAGTPITASLLEKTYGDLLRKYYGPNYTIDANDALEWAYIPHFYYKYYVYAYATGLASGIAIAEKIQKEGAPAQQAYLDMLRGGSAEPPLVLLRKAGVDLTRPDAIESAMRLFERTLEELEKLLAS
jgi:oligoendopeptidase F